ncbi:MAG: metalloregulator ArsR/SmtB family transcription factor [Cyclobacteriaceae bacterium]|nr:metalloregulator ArsR/SmtB family transcription factor [Cyclobacteriaceae bacterium]
MGLTKTKEFTKEENQLAVYAKALAHPARIAILNHLVQTRQCICGDLVDVLPLSQSTVSQHLKELKDAGLIKGNINGTRVCYCIDEKNWNKAKAFLSRFLESYTGQDCC